MEKTRDLESCARDLTYHYGVNARDYPTLGAFIEERIKRGIAVGFTFDECYDHWLVQYYRIETCRLYEDLRQRHLFH